MFIIQVFPERGKLASSTSVGLVTGPAGGAAPDELDSAVVIKGPSWLGLSDYRIGAEASVTTEAMSFAAPRPRL
jgi:hypothetical protein